MLTARTKLGLLSTAAAIVWLVLPGTANASMPSDIGVEIAVHDGDVGSPTLAFTEI